MKMVKSLLLGSAAGLVAVTAGQAAELPVKARPVEYVKICSLYGAGFYYMPGTDICIKVGGWVRYENAYHYGGSMTLQWWTNDLNNRSTVDDDWRVKGTATIDARSPSAYGTVRSFMAMGLSTNYNGNGGVSGVDNASNGAIVGTYFNRWFIQWAGFTIGHATSFYDFYSIGANEYGFASASSDTGDGGWDVFAYTAQFGGGVSATLSAELQRKIQLVNATSATTFGSVTVLGGTTTGIDGSGYSGQDWPDVVANLRVDQAWGSAQIMGALHEIQSTYYTAAAGGCGANAACETFGAPSNTAGWAVGGGITINTPGISPGDYFSAEADVSQGASRYDNNMAVDVNYSMFQGGSWGGGVNSDAVYVNGGSLQLTDAWQVVGAFTHFWTPAWKSTLWGSYLAETYNSTANAALCAAEGLGAACNNNWNLWGVGLRTEWAATNSLSLGVEVLYAELDGLTSPTGTIALAADGTKPAGTYNVSDQNNVGVRFRITRSFNPGP